MLSKILSKDECASCKFCCAFRRQSAWETPLFTEEQVNRRVLMLTPTCPSINKKPVEEIIELAEQGLAKKIFAYADTMPDMVKEYRENFIKIADA